MPLLPRTPTTSSSISRVISWEKDLESSQLSKDESFCSDRMLAMKECHSSKALS